MAADDHRNRQEPFKSHGFFALNGEAEEDS